MSQSRFHYVYGTCRKYGVYYCLKTGMIRMGEASIILQLTK